MNALALVGLIALSPGSAEPSFEAYLNSLAPPVYVEPGDRQQSSYDLCGSWIDGPKWYDLGCGTTPNYVAVFNGTDQFFSHPDDSRFTCGTNHCVIAACARLTSDPGGNAYIGGQWGDIAATEDAHALQHRNTDEVLRGIVRDTAATITDDSGSWLKTDTDWHCMAIRVDPGSAVVEACLDGSCSGSPTSYNGTVDDAAEQFTIGNIIWTGSGLGFWPGEIDLYAIWIGPLVSDVPSVSELATITGSPSGGQTTTAWATVAGVDMEDGWDFGADCDGTPTYGPLSLTNNNLVTCKVR